MKDIKHEMKNMSHCWFLESDLQIVLKLMYAKFLKVASHTQENKRVCSWACLLKHNQVCQFVKLQISSTSHTHVHSLSSPV